MNQVSPTGHFLIANEHQTFMKDRAFHFILGRQISQAAPCIAEACKNFQPPRETVRCSSLLNSAGYSRSFQNATSEFLLHLNQSRAHVFGQKDR